MNFSFLINDGERCAPEEASASGVDHRDLGDCERPHGRDPTPLGRYPTGTCHRHRVRHPLPHGSPSASGKPWQGSLPWPWCVHWFSITLGVEEGQPLEGTVRRTAISIPVAMKNRSGCLPVSRATNQSRRPQVRSGTSISISSVTRTTLTGGSRGNGRREICRSLGAFNRIFYRRRRVNIKRKSGNIIFSEGRRATTVARSLQEQPAPKYLGSDGSDHGAASQSRDSPDRTSCREP